MRQITKKFLNSYGLHRPLSVLALLGVDTVALLAGLVLAAYLVGGSLRVGEVVHFAPVLLAVWLPICSAHGLYERGPSRRNPGAVLGAVLWAAGLLSIGSVVYPESGFSLGEILIGASFALVLDGGMRLFYERRIESFHRRGLGLIPTIVVGGDEERARVRQAMEQTPGGYFCAGELGLNGQGIDLASLRQLLDRTRVRNVILVGAEQLPDGTFLDLLRSVRLRRVKMRVVPSAITLMRNHSVLFENLGLPLLEVGYPRLDNTQRALKRMLDVAGALGGLVVLSPLLIAVAILIRLTSAGPVFFRQKRAGADEKVFICYKFRSMYQDAEQRQAELETKNGTDRVLSKIKDDPRVTPIGRFIRRWSIDELPQLINVLKGEMSLVGPRPFSLRDFDRMGELHKERLAAVPGMTGYGQISGRSDLSFEEIFRQDLYYIENWSLSFDIKIILKTIGAVLRREGAF